MLVTKSSDFKVIVGGGRNLVKSKRFVFNINPFSGGLCYWDQDLIDKKKRINLIVPYLLGPLVSLALAIITLVVIDFDPIGYFQNDIQSYLSLFFWINLLGFTLTIIPMKYPKIFNLTASGYYSDGYHIMKALMRK